MSSDDNNEDASLAATLEEAQGGGGGGGYYGMYILGPMIRKFSENSIRSAEKLGGGLDKISQSVSSDCRHPSNVTEDEGGNDTSLIGTRSRAFLDAVQARAPDLYGRFVTHARAVMESDSVADAQVPVAIANFYDPVAYFGIEEGDDSVDRDGRMERARKRNYRVTMMPYMWMMYATRIAKASASPDALRAYLDKEAKDAQTARGRYS